MSHTQLLLIPEKLPNYLCNNHTYVKHKMSKDNKIQTNILQDSHHMPMTNDTE